jgi:hypothetical protein
MSQGLCRNQKVEVVDVHIQATDGGSRMCTCLADCGNECKLAFLTGYEDVHMHNNGSGACNVHLQCLDIVVNRVRLCGCVGPCGACRNAQAMHAHTPQERTKNS